MNEITVSVAGNVASDVVHRKIGSGTPVSSFRLASSTRYFDKTRREWTDGPTTWFTVFCFREFSENVMSSLSKGDPVVVAGRLTARDWEKDGRRGTSLEIEARHLGHDLARGSSTFKRRARPANSEEAGAALQEIGAAMAAGNGATTRDEAAPQAGQAA
ncbi:MAG: single-stranded DNA-binding protein [Actinomycetes bacterium]